MVPTSPHGSWFAILFAVAGCGGRPMPADASADVAWPCPAGWVTHAVGGCAPALLACAADGGAAPGACSAVDLAAPPSFVLADGATIPGIGRAPGGAFTGPWPSALWSPDAGGGIDPARLETVLATCPSVSSTSARVRLRLSWRFATA